MKTNNKTKLDNFKSIVRVDMAIDTSVSPTKVRITGNFESGSAIVVEFSMGCHADGVKVTSVSKTGSRRVKSLRDNHGRLAMVYNGYTVSVNELIHRLWFIGLGFPCEAGEYNHFYPVNWAGIEGEVFSPYSGDICSPEQNKAHWGCLSRIYKETGFKCAMDSHSPGYSILAKYTITRELVRQYAAVGYLTIMVDDGNPNV